MKKLNIHYIFIDKHDRDKNVMPDQVLAQRARYAQPEGIELAFHFHSYRDIRTMLLEYDRELAELVDLVDPDFCNVISNVGRLICLYRYGGIYHDVQFYLSESDLVRSLARWIDEGAVVLERHPLLMECTHVIRSGNMASSANRRFIEVMLERCKINLRKMRQEISTNPKARHCCWTQTGVGIIIDELIKANRQLLDGQGTTFGHSYYSGLYTIIAATQDVEASHYTMHYHNQLIRIARFSSALKSAGKFYQTPGVHWFKVQETKPLLRLPPTGYPTRAAAPTDET